MRYLVGIHLDYYQNLCCSCYRFDQVLNKWISMLKSRIKWLIISQKKEQLRESFLAFNEWKAVYVAGYIINNVQRTQTITK